jgi:hypothetical protein
VGCDQSATGSPHSVQECCAYLGYKDSTMKLYDYLEKKIRHWLEKLQIGAFPEPV